MLKKKINFTNANAIYRNNVISKKSNNHVSLYLLSQNDVIGTSIVNILLPKIERI